MKTTPGRKGIGGHQATIGATDEWLTPPRILKALGEFDLDPCAPIDRPWSMARNHLTTKENGLVQPWQGRIWLNPPYGYDTGTWLKKLADHGDGIALIFARTETVFFQEFGWQRASSMLFLRGRITFHLPSGTPARANSGGPSVLIAYGPYNDAALLNSELPGFYVPLAFGVVVGASLDVLPAVSTFNRKERQPTSTQGVLGFGEGGVNG